MSDGRTITEAGRINPAQANDRVPISRGGAHGHLLISDIAGVFIEYNVTASVALTIALIGGFVDVNVTVTGLLTTDRLIECQPLGDLPSGLGLVSFRCPSNNTLRLRFMTPVAISLGATNVNLRLSTQR